jgi:8-oxo-dGTP diphosphatase
MQEIQVVGAAIIDGNRVLAAQRSADMSTPLKWEFAGGKVEEGETHQQALKRELREELGVSVEVMGHIASGSSISGERKYLLHVYEARLLEGVPVSNEHAQLMWVDIGNIMELDWAEADLPACRELVRRNSC